MGSTLAYFNMGSITAVKCFMVQGPAGEGYFV